MRINNVSTQNLYAGNERIRNVKEDIGATVKQQYNIEDEIGPAVLLDDDTWVKFIPDPEKRANAQSALAGLQQKVADKQAAYKAAPDNYYVDGKGNIVSEDYDGLKVSLSKTGYDTQGYHIVNQLVSTKDMYTLIDVSDINVDKSQQSKPSKPVEPNESMLTLHLKTGLTDMDAHWTERPTTDTSNNIPLSNFIKVGVDRYKDLYAQIESYAATENKEGLDQSQVNRSINALDRAFGNYLVEALMQNGVTETEANDASSAIGMALRAARNSGASLDDSYTSALAALHGLKPAYAMYS